MKKIKKTHGLSKKIVSLTLAMLTATVVLTSCSTTASNSGSAESSKAADKPADTSAETPADTSSENNLHIQNQKIVDSPEWFKKLDAAKDCEQLIVVAGVGETTCYVSMHEKDADGNWKMILQAPGYVGLEGMGKADSYHATTPIGTFTIDKAFGIADDPGCQMEYTKVTEDDYWSGDMREGMHFNEFININDVPDLDKDSSEHLIDYTYEYTYCLNMGYNSECVPGEGSCFFFHCMSLVKPYTGGCVAVNEAVMRLIMQKVRDGCKITINKAEALGIDLNEARDFANKNI